MRHDCLSAPSPATPSHDSLAGCAPPNRAAWDSPPRWSGRLRLPRQRGDELILGLEQFLLVDDGVAVEDGAARVAGQAHGDPLGHAGADQGAGGGAGNSGGSGSARRPPGRLTGGAPRRARAADGDAVAVEDERALGITARQRRDQPLIGC